MEEHLDFKELCSQLKHFQQMNEDLQQQVHELKSNLSRAEFMKTEMESDIERLQSQLRSNKSENITIQNREGALINSWSTKITNLQSELQEEREQSDKMRFQIADLESKIASLENAIPLQITNEEANNDELAQLKAEVNRVNEKFDFCLISLQQCEMENMSLKERNQNLEECLRETKDVLESKNEELRFALDELQSVQEEKILMSTELASLKADNVGDLKRGNSLFAEVDDRRQTLESKIEMLKSKLILAKRMLAVKSAEYQKLRSENIQLHRFCQEDEKNSQTQLDQLRQRYSQRITELTQYIKVLEQRPESPQFITLSDTDLSQFQWIHTVVENSRAEVRVLREELQAKSEQHLLHANDLYLAQQEVRSLKVQIKKDKGLLDELKMQSDENNKVISALREELAELKEKGCTCKAGGERRSQESQSSKVHFAEDVKENDGDACNKVSRIPKQQPYLRLMIKDDKVVPVVDTEPS